MPIDKKEFYGEIPITAADMYRKVLDVHEDVHRKDRAYNENFKEIRLMLWSMLIAIIGSAGATVFGVNLTEDPPMVYYSQERTLSESEYLSWRDSKLRELEQQLVEKQPNRKQSF